MSVKVNFEKTKNKKKTVDANKNMKNTYLEKKV